MSAPDELPIVTRSFELWNRLKALGQRIERGVALIESDGVRMPALSLADRLESPGYSRLLELVARGDEAAVDLATRRFTLEVHRSTEAAARRRTVDLALSLLIDTAIATQRSTTMVLDRGLGEPGAQGHHPGGLYLCIDRWQNGDVVASIVTDYADVVPREGLNSALLSLASWWTIPTAAPHKPIFRKTWAAPTPDASASIAAAVALAVVQVLDAVGGHPVALRHTLRGHPIVRHLKEPPFARLDPAADRSIARAIVRIPREHWKVPTPAETDPRVETETVRATVANAERQASEADDELSLIALGDVLTHLDGRRTYEGALLDWLAVMAQQRDALAHLTTRAQTSEGDPR